ncbi:MAG: hydrolase [Gammaproteobacteria bacterium]|nr:hydrolase [Gammaproteobacteria bacterium]
MPLIDSAFRPAWWLPGAHLQTLWPALARRPTELVTHRERLELDDGDFLDLVWSGPPRAPVVLFLHGLEGGLRSHYATSTMRRLAAAGLRTCLLLFRNCGDEPNRLPISYHSGKTDDPQRVVEHIVATTGGPPLGAVGVSLGGNVLLKWLGELGDRSPLQRAMAISVPFRLDDCARRLERGFSRVYQHHLVSRLQRSYLRKFGQGSGPLDMDVRDLRTFRQFDDRVTAALHGFAGVDDYYARCSSRPFIASIRVPTLILQARNDPFMTADTPPSPAELPDKVWLEMPADGGHVGFIGGRNPLRAQYYLEQRIVDWFTRPLPADVSEMP